MPNNEILFVGINTYFLDKFRITTIYSYIFCWETPNVIVHKNIPESYSSNISVSNQIMACINRIYRYEKLLIQPFCHN